MKSAPANTGTIASPPHAEHADAGGDRTPPSAGTVSVSGTYGTRGAETGCASGRRPAIARYDDEHGRV